MKSLLFLALIAHSTLAAYNYPLASGSSYGLKLRPPFITMVDDNTYGTPIYISLKAIPKAGKVTVYFEMPNFIASKCRLDFTKKNWNKEQIIRVTRLPYLTTADANRVTEGSFLVAGPGEKFDRRRQKFQIIRSGGAGATCSALGDPHYTTFAGRAHHFQGLGPYYLIKSPLLTIQQYNIPFGGAATVQNLIAIRYHKTVYVFNSNTVACSLASDANENVEILSIPGVTWRVVLSDGTVVNMTRVAYVVNFFNIDITIGTLYAKRLSGLCGQYEVPANGAFMMSNNAPTEDINSFGNSWRVPDNDNLFTLGDKAISVTAPEDPQNGVGGEEFCELPNPDDIEDDDTDGTVDYGKGELNIKKVKRIDFNVINVEIKKGMNRPVIPERAPVDAWAQQARTKCVTLLTIKECNDILDPKIYVDDCIDDCVLSGGFDFIDAAKERYMVAVRRLTNSVLNEPAIRDGVNRAAESLKKKAKAVAEKVGLNEVDCPDDCGENGTCTPHGCDCNQGYSGIDCSEENPENPGEKKAFTNKKVVGGRNKVQDAPKPKIATDVQEAEKLEAPNMAKKLKALGR